MANSGANALVVIRDTLPATLAELTAERGKLVAKIRELNEQIVEAETHMAVSGAVAPPRGYQDREGKMTPKESQQ